MGLLDRFRLADRVALVTGAGRGIGRAIGLAFAEMGADVVLAARTEAELAAAADAVRGFGRRALPVRCDVTDPAQLEEVVRRTMAEFGRLDLLVNNAGGFPPMPFLDTEPASWEWCFKFNLTSAFLLTRACLPHMLAGDGGAVLNISSAAGRIVRKGFVAYGTAKAALSFMTRQLAAEFAPRVRVNALAVGAVETAALAPFRTSRSRRCGSARPPAASSPARWSRSTAASNRRTGLSIERYAMPYRVIQWSTGNVGHFALGAILDHPELELAGLWVHGAAKAGKDAGELCGRPRTGVHATTDAGVLLALDADCVCYTATADLRPFEAVEDVCRILAAGKNVVSSSIVPLVHPASFFPEVRDKLAEACRRGRTSFFTSGIDPGFANDLLPLTLSGLCQRWEQIRILEIINYATYDQPQVLFETMGFGKPLDHIPLLLTPGTLAFAWGGTVRLLAEGLGVTLEDIRETYERRPAVRPIRIGARTVEPGTMAALRFEVQGIADGTPAIVVEHVTRLDDDLAPEWPRGNGSYRVVITGTPTMRCEFEFADEGGDHAVGGVLLTATRIVNAIPAVCRAAPGLLSALDLPLVTGRGLRRRG
jgi:NADP-dependent 3-hydroxy acid dehydrogenase YdfG